MHCFIYRLCDECAEEQLLYGAFIYFCRTTMHHFEQLLSSNDATVFNSTWIMVPAAQFYPPLEKHPDTMQVIY